MRLHRRLESLFRNVFGRNAVERDLDEELESYVVLLAEEKLREGIGPAEARRRALLELGGKEAVKELVRDRSVGEPFRVLLRDLSFGARMLGSSPGFTALAVLTLALGIGASSAVFSVAHAILLRELPYRDPDRLVFAWTHTRDGRMPFSPPDFTEFVEQTQSYLEIAAIQGDGLLTLSVDGRPEPVRARPVSPNFLAAYGAAPYIGRSFFPEEDSPIAFEDWGDPDAELPTGVVMIGYELFRDRFGSDPAVLGKTIRLDLHPYEIVGVTPPGFRSLIPEDGDYAASADVWWLSRMDFPRMPRDVSFLRAVGRLREGVSLAEAKAEANVFAERQRSLFPMHRESGFSLEIVPLRESVAEGHGAAIWILFGAVGFVLLIACANLANLLLSRSAARERELAVRMALGAGRGRLVRQMLTESLLYALLGGGGGLLLSILLVEVFLGLAPPSLPRAQEIRLDGAVLGFTLATATLAALLVGLVPAFRFSRPGSIAALRMAGRETASSAARRWDGLLVVGEVALSVVLLVGTTLLLRSLVSLLHVEPGFEPDRVLTAEMSLSSRRYPRYPRADARVRFVRQVSDRLSEMAGVEAVGLALVVPLSGQDAGHSYATESVAANAAVFPPAKYRPVTPGYFGAVGTRLVAGRLFDWTDLEGERLVTIVDEKLARKAWPRESALGKRLRIEVWSTRNGPIQLEPLWTEVVGVVEDVRSSGLDREDLETVYLPYNLYAVSELSLLVRAAAEPAALSEGVREAIGRIDPDIAVFNFRVMNDWIAESVSPRRFSLTLLTAFGLEGLFLALVGIYGVLSSSVSLRSRELGLRMALGALPRDVLRSVMTRGAPWIAAGLALGLLGAAALSRFLASQLYAVRPTDPLVYSGVAVLTAAVSLAACFLPARRAARIDPMKTLRLE